MEICNKKYPYSERTSVLVCWVWIAIDRALKEEEFCLPVRLLWTLMRPYHNYGYRSLPPLDILVLRRDEK